MLRNSKKRQDEFEDMSQTCRKIAVAITLIVAGLGVVLLVPTTYEGPLLLHINEQHAIRLVDAVGLALAIPSWFYLNYWYCTQRVDTQKMDTVEATTFRRAFLSGLVLYLIGFVVGEDLLAFLFTRGGQIPFSKFSGEAEAVFFSVNILIKGILLFLFTRWASRHNLFHGRFVFTKRTAVISVIILLISLFLSVSFPQVKSNFLDSWNYFNRLHGFPFGLINTVLQYVYYIFEGLMMIWIADMFQTAGETRSRQPKIPWGGLALGLLWGLGHIFGKGWFTALTWALPFGIAVGVVYLLDKKNVLAPFLFWMIFNTV